MITSPDPLRVVAEALDRLGTRIHRDLDVESSYSEPVTDPKLAALLADICAYAEECLTALDDPAVIAAFYAAQSRSFVPPPPRTWRARWLGRLLNVHSPSAHAVETCWCQRRPLLVETDL